MRTNVWLLGGIFFCSGLLAQQVTNAPPASQIEAPAPAPALTNTAPAPTTTATAKPAKKPSTAKKSAAKKPAAKKPAVAASELRTIPLKPGPATVVASNVNVRGQARLKSEVVTRLTKGQEVTVLEEITLKDSGPEEPSAWAKIALPQSVHVWVNALFVDPATKTVKPKKLNLRGGPGENYSVLGVLEQGATIKELSAKGDWLEMEAPPSAYAFMAAQYLRQETQPEVASTQPAATTEMTPPTTTEPATTTTPPATTEPAPPPTTPATVSETPAAAAATSETPSGVTPPPGTTEKPAAAAAVTPGTEGGTNAVAAAAPAVDEPPPPRIVLREGILRGSTSIQAPTHFELYSPDTGKLINYLYTSSRDLDLGRYKGLRIIVTGEEGLDERWRNTPVLTIQRIQVLE